MNATTTVAIANLTRTYEGKVWVANRERNMYDDSDFLATFWVEGTEEFEEVEIGSTRYGGGRNHKVPVSTNPELLALYRKWLDKKAAAAEAKTIRVGKSCTLQNARKYKGQGIIKWIGRDFHDSRIEVAGIQFDNGYTVAHLYRVQLA